jgi:hypothetical protein
MADYMHAHDVSLARRDRIEAELEQLAGESICAQTIARLGVPARGQHPVGGGDLRRGRPVRAL